jgi:hypothetical protein
MSFHNLEAYCIHGALILNIWEPLWRKYLVALLTTEGSSLTMIGQNSTTHHDDYVGPK